MKIEELPIQVKWNHQIHWIYPTLIEINNELTLVDTGYSNLLPQIEGAIKEKGYNLRHLKNILITHYDDDHIGSLADFKEKYPHVTIMASEKEAPFISGDEKSERLEQAEKILETISEDEKMIGEGFVENLKCLKHVKVDVTVQDGEEILHKKCKVIATPGHTSGHISLYFPSVKSVVTGDASVVEDSQLVIANPQFCLDQERANQSLHKLKQLDATHYYCYHGGRWTAST